MSNTFTHDAASNNRQRLIRGASLDGHSLLNTMLIRTGFVLKDIQNGLIKVSHSKTKLMTTLTAGALIGFAIGAGAFSLKNADNEMAAMQEATKVSMPDKAGTYERQLNAMLNRSQSTLKSAENRLDQARNSDTQLFNKCLMNQISTKECKTMRRVISTAQSEIESATSIINYVNNSSDSAVKLGNNFSLEFYQKSEEARQSIVLINKKFSTTGPNGDVVGLFQGKTFKDVGSNLDM